MRVGLEKLLLDSELRSTYIGNALARVKNFSWRETAEKTARIYTLL